MISALAAAGCTSHQVRPLVIQSPSSPAREAKASPAHTELKLATFNVWGLPWWINGASSDRFVRIAGELDKLNPDFATLQEVWTRKAERSASLTTGWWIAKPAQSHSVFRRSGLVTLSRHPIVGGEFHPFRTARLPDMIVSKGALKTTIELESGLRVNLWNVHLQAGESAADERARCQQVSELAACVNAADDGQVADIVSGDFNCEPGSPPYQRLRGNLGAEDATLVGAQPLYTYDGMNPGGKTRLALDHIITRLRQPVPFASANPEMIFAAAKRQDRLSDHCGVQVGFNFTPVVKMAEAEQTLVAVRHEPATKPVFDLAIPVANSTALNQFLPH